MAMNFFEHQEKARRNSQLLVLLFAVAVVGIAAAIYLAARGALGLAECKENPACRFTWWDPVFFLYVFGGTLGFSDRMR